MKRQDKNQAATRVKKVLLGDKISMPDGLTAVLKNDLYTVISSFFEMDRESLTVEINYDEKDSYQIAVTAVGDKLKRLKYLE